MTIIIRAICWAAAILVVAGCGRYGLIDHEAANTLTIVLPIVAWLSLDQGSCLPPRREV